MTKRALCIGINDYPGTNSDLNGCVNDANDWREALESRGYEVESLLDDQATKANIVQGMTDIVGVTTPNDIAVITYAGHGTRVPNEVDGDKESDKKDEALCPYDAKLGNLIIDDEIGEIFGKKRHGARIVLISDSCHSGTMTRGMAKASANSTVSKIRYLPPEVLNPPLLDKNIRRSLLVKKSKKIYAAAVLLAACKDREYAYDAPFDGRFNGAFSYFALQALKELPQEATYRDWYLAIRAHLPHDYFPQTPRLTCRTYQKKWRALTA